MNHCRQCGALFAVGRTRLYCVPCVVESTRAQGIPVDDEGNYLSAEEVTYIPHVVIDLSDAQATSQEWW